MTVSDGLASASAQTTVRVDDLAPSVGLLLQQATVDEGGLAALQISLADAGVLDSQRLVIDWGDGSAAETVDLAAGTTTLVRTHRYLDDNPSATPVDAYTVRVQATDKDGLSTSATATLTVVNLAPALAALQLQQSSPSASQRDVVLTGSYGDVGTPDTHTVEIDWGDGSRSAAVVDAQARSFTASHRYATTSSVQKFTIVALVRDDDGGTGSGSIESAGSFVNTPPVARDDAATVAEDGSVQIELRSNDSDVDNDALAVQLVDGPQHGSALRLADGRVLYTPNANFNGADSFTYRLSDGTALSNTATVRISVTAVNDAPTLQAIADQQVAEGSTLQLQLLGSDVDGNALQYSLVSGAGASVSASGLFSLQAVDGPASVPVTVRVSDGSLVAERSFSVLVSNLAPTVGNLQLQESRNASQRQVLLTGSIGDAGLPDTHTVQVAWGDGSSSAAVVDAATRSFSASHVFTLASAAQAFSIVATATDDDGASGSAGITSRGGAGNVPVARDDAATVAEDGTVRIDLLANDSDAESDPLTVQALGTAAHGTVALNADGSVQYTPDANFNGADSFSYRAADASGQSNLATVRVTVTPVNDAPTLAAVVNQRVDEGSVLQLQLQGSDVDGNALTYSLVSAPGAGVNASVSASGLLTLQAVDGPGTTPVTVRVSDGAASAERSFSVQIDNVAPRWQTLALSAAAIDEDGSVQLTGVLIDPGTQDSQTVLVDWGDGSAVQTVSLAAGQTTLDIGHRYADDNPSGTPVDTYTVSVQLTDKDGFGGNDSRSLQVRNLSPAVVGLQLQESRNADLRQVSLVGTVTDIGALDTHTVLVAWGDGSSTQAVVDAQARSFSASHTYTTQSASQPFTIVATATDDDTGTGSASVVSRGSAGTAPVASDDSASVAEDGTVRIDVLANDRDAENDPLTVQDLGAALHGTVVRNADGSLQYTPDANFNGSDSFTYRAADGSGQSNLATVRVTVTAVNDAPTLQPVAARVLDEGGVLQIQLQAQDVDGDALVYDVGGGAGTVQASVDAGGLLTLRGLDGAADAVLTISASDGRQQASQSLVVQVRNVAPVLNVSGPSQLAGGTPLVITLGSNDPGADTIARWEIDWGDGNTVILAGNPGQASHVYGPAGGSFSVQARAVDEDGTWAAAPLQVQVAPDLLNVTSFVPTATGFAVRFDQAIDAARIGLYGPPDGTVDVELRGDARGVVRGSLVLDADGRGLRFIATGGVLAADQYSVTLASGPLGFVSASGALDGDNNGQAGDAYRARFSVAAAPSVVLGLPDFMRGAGQAVDVPGTAQGLPVSITSTGGLRQLQFTLAYDPALLTVSAARAGSGLPAGSSVQMAQVAGADGRMLARVTVVLPAGAALAAGTVRVVDLVATVPAGAAYGAQQVLDLTVTQLDGVAPAAGQALDDDALHVAGYFGDSNRSGGYSVDDVTLLQNVIVRTTPGFAAWRNTDPVVVGDIAGGGTLNSLDASRLLQEVNFLQGSASVDRPEIPPIPGNIGPLVFAAVPGVGQTVAVPAAAGSAAASAPQPASQSAPLRIDLSAALASTARVATTSQDWLRDYLVSAAQPARVSPNATLRVTLPAAPAATLAVAPAVALR